MKTKLELSNNKHLWRNLSFGLIGLWLFSAAALFSGLVPLPGLPSAPIQPVAEQVITSQHEQPATLAMSGVSESPAVASDPDKTSAIMTTAMDESLAYYQALGHEQSKPEAESTEEEVTTGEEQSGSLTMIEEELKTLRSEIGQLHHAIKDLTQQLSMLHIHGTSTESVASRRSTETRPKEVQEEEVKRDDEEKYTVKKGDALSLIAEAKGLTTGCLIAWNELSYPYIIDVGQKLALSGSKDNCVPAEIWTAPYKRLAQSEDKPVMKVKADKFSELKIIGMSDRYLALATDEDSPVHLYTLGELIKGMGMLESIDVTKRQAKTSSGIVLQADPSP